MAIVSIIGSDGAPMNLGEVQAWNGVGGGLTPGNYIFEVEEVIQEAAKSSGNLQLVVTLRVLNGDTEVHNGQTTKHWLSLTPKAAGRLKAFMDAVGLAPGADGTSFDDQELVGRQFMAEVFEQDVRLPDEFGENLAAFR